MSAESITSRDEFSLRVTVIDERPDPDGRIFCFLAVYRHYAGSTKPSFRRGVLDNLSTSEILDLMDDPTVVLAL